MTMVYIITCTKTKTDGGETVYNKSGVYAVFETYDAAMAAMEAIDKFYSNAGFYSAFDRELGMIVASRQEDEDAEIMAHRRYNVIAQELRKG